MIEKIHPELSVYFEIDSLELNLYNLNNPSILKIDDNLNNEFYAY